MTPNLNNVTYFLFLSYFHVDVLWMLKIAFSHVDVDVCVCFNPEVKDCELICVGAKVVGSINS